SWRNDNSLTGQNPHELMLTPASVSSTTSPIFGKLFGCAVDQDDPMPSEIFAQPLYAANVTIANVTRNVVYVATEHDSVYAFDADVNPCQTLWHVSFIDSSAGVTTVPAGDIPGQTDIVREIGITGTPVIDPNTATLYVLDKTKENGAYVQRLHALDLTNGADKFGGPVLVRDPSNGVFDSMSLTENQR